MREWRKTHPLSPAEQIKANTRSRTRAYVDRGLILKKPCEICGSPKVEAHHPDYSRAWLVHWLCKFHHHELHRRERMVQKLGSVSRPKIGGGDIQRRGKI